VLPAYYARLGANAEFAADLRQLFDRWDALTAGVPRAHRAVYGLLRSEATPQERRAAQAVGLALRAFVQNWPCLPATTRVADLRVSYRTRATWGGELRHPISSGAAPASTTIIGPIIVPPFDYDPTVDDRAWLDAEAERIGAEVAAAIREQGYRGEQALQAQGYAGTRPGWASAQAWDVYARRLYRWAVLRHSWGRVAAEDEDRVTPSAVQQLVLALAQALGVAQCPGPKVTRPRRARR
jgi:hypothetical protein